MGEGSRCLELVAQGHTKLCDLVRDAMYLHDADFEKPLLDVNDAACRMLGYTRAELLRLTIADVDAAEIEPVPVHVRAALAAEGHVLFERVHRAKNGRLIPVEIQADAVQIEGERLTLSLVRDISNRQQLERDLHRQRMLVERIVEAAPVGVVCLDRDGVITFANQQAQKCLHLTPREFGTRGYDAPSWQTTDLEGFPIPEEDLPFARAMATRAPVMGVQQAIRVGEQRVVVSVNAVPLLDEEVPFDGVVATDLHAAPSRDVEGQVTGVVEFVRDVSAQRHAQHLLRLQRDLVAALSTVDDFDEALRVLLDVVVGIPGIEVTTIALRRSDGSAQIVAARGLGELVSPSLPSDHPLAVALDRVEPLYLEGSNLAEGLGARVGAVLGEMRAAGIVPITHEGRVMGSLVVASRSTDDLDPSIRNAIETIASQAGGALGRIRVQTELRRYAETQAVLLREVNHRVKNNLAAIISILHKEQERAAAASREIYPELLQEMVARVGSLATVHRLLSESHWQPLALNQLCRSVMDAVVRAHKSPERVTVEVEASDVAVGSDLAHHVALVVNELATNSLKYAPAGREHLTLRVAMGTEGVDTWLRIVDDGPGFPEAVLDSGRASGLGLELVQGIVGRTLRGRLKLSNAPGASVEIWFPAARSEGAA